jgi:hypothetical protein
MELEGTLDILYRSESKYNENISGISLIQIAVVTKELKNQRRS